MKSFYITTTLPYVNSEPHIGFALEIVTADVIARCYRLNGNQVVFNTGTDEHGQKIFQAANLKKMEVQKYVDGYAAKFKDLNDLLNLSVTHFIRTTDASHIDAAQNFFERCVEKGDIYKKLYKIKYCVGCELEKTESELVEGYCPLHPKMEIELIEEENYFFKFSKYQQPLLDWYNSHPDFVKPQSKQKEIIAFVSHGLEDFSVSRLKAKMPWGIEVPNDPTQVMYVWFDALINYISTLGWPNNSLEFNQYWPGTQIAGKDNLRQQAAMWQAMLLSADLPLSKQILINGFISIEHKKMSKSLGNVITPNEMVKRYGIDATRYLLVSLGPISTDMDVSLAQFDTSYNGFLANSLGNTISRIANLCSRSSFNGKNNWQKKVIRKEIMTAIMEYNFNLALDEIWKNIRDLEKKIDDNKPWNMLGNELSNFLKEAIEILSQIGADLEPIMPDTTLSVEQIFSKSLIVAPKPLFPRIK